MQSSPESYSSLLSSWSIHEKRVAIASLYTKGGDLYTGMNTRRRGLLGATLEVPTVSLHLTDIYWLGIVLGDKTYKREQNETWYLLSCSLKKRSQDWLLVKSLLMALRQNIHRHLASSAVSDYFPEKVTHWAKISLLFKKRRIGKIISGREISMCKSPNLVWYS